MYPHLAGFLPYLDLLQSESARGRVLISTGYIEEQLKQILLAFMRDLPAAGDLVSAGNALVGTLSARIAACYALNLITETEHHDVTLLRRIRNDFAHDMHTTFETPSVVDRCKNLRLKAHDYTSDETAVVVLAASHFTSAAVALILNFTNQDHYVSKVRRGEVVWPY